jgi:hypothetical protein
MVSNPDRSIFDAGIPYACADDAGRLLNWESG